MSKVAVTPGEVFATITGVVAVHPAAVRQLFEATDLKTGVVTDVELAALLGGQAPLSTYLTFSLPAWQAPQDAAAIGRLPPLPYHDVTVFYGDRAIASKVSVERRGPMRFGDRLSSYWRVAAVEERTTRLGPGTSIDFETEFVNQHDEPVALEQTTVLVFGPSTTIPERKAEGSSAQLDRLAGDGAPFDPAAPQVGQSMPRFELAMSLQRLAMVSAANRDFAPVHHDPRAAAEIGAPEPIVNSMFLLSLAERLALEAAGLDSTVRRLGPLRMLRPTPAGQSLVCSGRLLEVNESVERVRVNAEVFVEIAGGGMTARCQVEFDYRPRPVPSDSEPRRTNRPD